MNSIAAPALPLLYTYRRCPYAMRARLALLVAQQPFDAFEIALRDKPAAMLALSPKGTVPVLQLPDGQVIDESWEIMVWALQRPGVEHWWHLAQTAENLELLRRNDGEFKHHLDRYKYPERYADDGHSREDHRAAAVASLLLPLEARLTQHAYLAGQAPCATDLAIFPFVRQFAAVDTVWFLQGPWPALHAWLNGWLGSPLFETCMAKLPSQSILRFPGINHF
ncbi:MAG: glutathione S-transferase [Burkholderiaceae bacterium]